MSDGVTGPGRRLPRRFHFPRHLAAFTAVAATALAAELVSGSDWPLFWPLAVWSVALAVHYFLASAYDLDREWVDERIAELRSRSYDFDHIRNIEQRVRDRDPSVTPATERKPDRSDS